MMNTRKSSNDNLSMEELNDSALEKVVGGKGEFAPGTLLQCKNCGKWCPVEHMVVTYKYVNGGFVFNGAFCQDCPFEL